MRSHRTGLLIIATAALGFSAPPAQADTQYGGNGLFGGNRPANPSISLLRRDDGSVAGRVVLAASCRGYASYSMAIRLSGRTADGVNFSVSGRSRLGRRMVRVTLTGTLDAGQASGTATWRTGCRRFSLPFSLRTESAPVGAPAVPAPGTLMFGLTSQSANGMRLPVSLRVTKNGRVYASWQSLVQCSRGRLPVLDHTPSRRIRADGTFGGSQTYTIRYKGFSERYRVSFHGRFTADGASGTLRTTMRFRRSGSRYAPCRSGQQTWAARG